MKTTFDYFKYLIICVVICAFAACGDDDDKSGSDAVIEIAEEMKAITCTGAGNDSKTITFTAKNDWTAIASHSWIDLSKRAGSAGEQSVIVTVEDNTEFKTRIGTITIKDKVSGKTVDVTITQGEKGSVLTFASNKGDDKSQGGTLIINDKDQVITDTVNIASNYEYEVKIDAAWLTSEKVGKNADGSMKYVFHADPKKMYEATGYKEQSATVSFGYQAVTRVPETKQYQVKFAGITPSIISDASPVVLEDDGENYKATVHLTSNMEWTLGNTTLSFAKVDYSNGENNSKQYFKTETSVTLTYNKAELQVEEETDKMTFADAAGKLAYTLEVKYPGVGNNYVYLDRTSFNLNSDYVCLFAAQGDPDPEAGAGMFKDLSLNFKVKAAQKDNMAFYIVRQNFAGAPIYATYMDSYGDEKSTDMTGYQGWGFVEDPEAAAYTRTNVETITKTLYIRSRGNEWDGSSNEAEDRYFAFFAVSKAKYPDFSALFDEEGNLKSELESSYIVCIQKASVSIKDFECAGLTGKTLQVAATGATLTFKYSGLELGDEKWGASWTYGNFEINKEEGVLTREPENWGTTGEMITSYDLGQLGDDGFGTLTIVVAPNSTGKARTENFALFSGVAEFNNAVFTYFTIEQAAE